MGAAEALRQGACLLERVVEGLCAVVLVRARHLDSPLVLLAISCVLCSVRAGSQQARNLARNDVTVSSRSTCQDDNQKRHMHFSAWWSTAMHVINLA